MRPEISLIAASAELPTVKDRDADVQSDPSVTAANRILSGRRQARGSDQTEGGKQEFRFRARKSLRRVELKPEETYVRAITQSLHHQRRGIGRERVGQRRFLDGDGTRLRDADRGGEFGIRSFEQIPRVGV